MTHAALRWSRPLVALLLVLAAFGVAPSPPSPASAAPAAPAATVGSLGSGGSLARADDAAGTEGRMVLLLDSSGSMAEPAGHGETRIVAARKALTDVVHSLPATAQVGLRVFGATVFSRSDPGACTDSQQVVAPGTDNRAQLLSAIGDYRPYGETPIPSALRQAAADLGSEGPRSIVLVSDGESTCRPDPCVVARELSRQGVDLQIDVVGLSVSGAARAQLQCVAEAGNGQYYDADSAADIESRITRVAARALRPFTLTGTPIQGGPTDAPTPVTAGDWLDTLDAAGSRSYSFERTTAGTTLRAAAVTQGSRGNDGVAVAITGPDGTRCDSGTAARALDVRQLLGALATASAETGCDAAGTYTITVSRVAGSQGRIPVELRVTEEPPFDDPGFTPDSSTQQVSPPAAGRPSGSVVGGSSFVTAPVLAPGTWRSTIVPGEALVLGFDLDFGQSASIAVRFPPGSPAVRSAVAAHGLLADLTLYDPMQATTALPDGSAYSRPVGGSEATTLATGTPPVSRTLIGTRGYNGVDDHSTAGTHYVGVSLMRAPPGVPSVEVPFTVTIEVTGQPQSGPVYADGATWTVADQLAGTATPLSSASPGSPSSTATPSGPAAPGDGTSAAAADEGSSIGTIGLVGLVAVLLLGGAAVALRLRRGASDR